MYDGGQNSDEFIGEFKKIKIIYVYDDKGCI